MRNERSDENGGTCGNVADLARVELERVQVTSGVEVSVSEASTPAAVNILISGGGDSHNNQLETIAIVKLDICKDEKDEKSPKKVAHSRSQSYGEQCRVCQQPSDEALMELGCRCRGELAKAHKSCIELWFRTRGSNRCEICQQVAVNVPPPDSQPTDIHRNMVVAWYLLSIFSDFSLIFALVLCLCNSPIIGFGGLIHVEDQILDREAVKGDASIHFGLHSQFSSEDFYLMC
ncbi:uncharacterized protein LOC18436383 isoform X2 [Amborella trichopoda]|uniref:uncharacterized protein LOC18436383 isoform X2 n=1 Tax=Amborella trichopoda TaxID=13333 RepID=UPI0009BE7D21|nr:uncharacterized protein LOC18436383 isoform X2 [Amborella trichopoda]|eukprot:XP_020524279.1 uncharacterized protein LOC18436383 isoform X2 [Amborella trichopoda]